MGVLFSSLRWGNLSSSGIFTFSRLRNLFTATRKIAVAAEKKTIKAAEEPKHILIVGGAYSGLATIITIQKILGGALHSPGPYNLPEVKILPRVAPRITLLDERDGIYHTVGTPLAHTSPDVKTVLPRTWKKYSDIEYLKDVEVIHGRVDTLDASRKEVHYTAAVGDKKVVLSYDYLVCGTGLKRAWPIQPRATTKEEFIRDATELVQGLVDAKERIVVVGGGAVGTEFAGELKLTHPGKRITLIHSRSHLLSTEPLPEEFKEKALELLIETGVEVLLNTRVLQEASGELQLSTGETIKASAVIWCVGRQHPSTGFLPAAALNPKTGSVRISSTFNFPAEVPNYKAHFAIGDIAEWSGIKRVGSALLMGSFAATNVLLSIVAAETGEKLKLGEFPEVVPMLVLALGHKAVGYHPSYGFSHGEAPLKQSFGDDLGLSICWNCLNLTVDGAEVAAVKEKK